MSTVALEVVAAFEALPDAERDAVVAELLVRFPMGAGRFTDDDFVDMADEVFKMYDTAEG